MCGHCGAQVASEKGYCAQTNVHTGIAAVTVEAFIYICHKCCRPTFIDHDGTTTPGVPFGNSVKDIGEPSVRDLYEEARRATGARSYTAAVLCCRKLLMHIAVSKGAKEGDNFVSYVEYLSAKNYVPPDARDWVDHIRKKGNETNHEISIMKKEDAEELLGFIEMLLRVIYEFPSAMKRKYAGKTS